MGIDGLWVQSNWIELLAHLPRKWHLANILVFGYAVYNYVEARKKPLLIMCGKKLINEITLRKMKNSNTL